MHKRFFVGLFLLWSAISLVGDAGTPRDPLLVQDVGRLGSARVHEILRPTRIEALRDALARARRLGLKVSIAGRRHSQGGHIFTDDALLIDMTDFDQVLSVDADEHLVTVEAGATWAEVQEALNPHGLAVATMQSSNIFTVGGTLACNAHGRDPRQGPVIESVQSFRLLRADGTIVDIDRETEPELFGLVIGGYGLFGVILDADIRVVDDARYELTIEETNYRDYESLFRDRVLGRDDICLHSARLSIAPGAGFLADMYAKTYREIGGGAPVEPLRRESNVARDRFFFGLSRRFRWGKRLRWALQRRISDPVGTTETVTRNNAMRPNIEFLMYTSETDTDILQEYFVPLERFVPFVDALRDVMVRRRANLLHATVRYVPENHDAFLSYAPADMFALVLYFNIGLSPAAIDDAQTWTRELVDLALDNNGSYYLVYQQFPTREQSRRAYPDMDEFFELKGRYDPDLLFMNRFYEHYGPQTQSR